MNKKPNKGMTMIEILVAFVMLTLVMVIMYSCMKFASNLLREATDIDRNNALFQEAVVDLLGDESGYKQGKNNPITYVFSGTDSNGNDIPEFNYSIYTKSLSFKKKSTGYEVTTDTSDNDVRRIYFFSTGD